MLRGLMRVVLVVPLASILSFGGLEGQDGLRTRIQNELFTFGECGVPLCLDVGNAHGNHFIPGVSEGNAAVIGFISDAVSRSTASVPLGATSSGATFTFEGGLPVRTSTSAGPIFGERSQTLGRGRYFFGVSLTSIDFTSLNGVPTRSIRLNVAHEDNDPVGVFGDPQFENDVIAMDLSLDASVLVGTVAATVGVTDYIDVGVAVPLVRTSVRGRNEAQIMPFGAVAPHYFAGDATDPVLRAVASMEGSAAGIGDVAGRVKVNLGQGETMGAAVLGEVRFPTGDEEDLLGAGATQIRAMGIYSAQFGDFSPHLNAGYTIRNADAQSDAFLVNIGIDNLMSEWATLAAGLVSEWEKGDSEFQLPPDIEWTTPFSRRLPATSIPDKRNNVVSATLGAKFTVRGGTVLTVNSLFPLRDVGFQPDAYWTIGMDFSF